MYKAKSVLFFMSKCSNMAYDPAITGFDGWELLMLIDE